MEAIARRPHEYENKILQKTVINKNLITKVITFSDIPDGLNLYYYAVMVDGKHYEITKEQYDTLVKEFELSTTNMLKS